MADLPLAIVTGGAHRLGRAFAIDLARGGFAVLVHYHRSAEGAAETVALVEQSGVPAFSAQADLTQDRGIDLLFKQVDHLLETPESNLSHLAVLVNSAAMMLRGDVQSLTVEEWESTLNLNLQAPLLCAQKAAKRMKPGGLIVNVSDVGAEKAWSRFPAYVPSKAALNSLTKVMARSLAPSIRVNAMRLHFIANPSFRRNRSR